MEESVTQPGAVQMDRTRSDLSSISVGNIVYCESSAMYAGAHLFEGDTTPSVEDAVQFAQELQGNKHTLHTTTEALIAASTALLLGRPNVQV